MPPILKRFCYDLAALASGVLLVFAFAPFSYSYLSIVAVSILLLTLMRATPRQAAFRGFLFGLGLYGLGVSWVYVSIHTFGQTPVWLAGLITLGFVCLLAFFSGVQMYLWRRFFRDNSANSVLLAFPVLWVVFEWIRTVAFTGFPWLFLGYSQTDTVLAYLAPIGSVYLVSLMVALNASLIVFGFYLGLCRGKNKRQAFYSVLAMSLIWLVAFSFHDHHWAHSQSTALKVALIQSNIPQSVKWDPAQAEKSLALYWDATQALWGSSIVVWPEGAVPLLQDEAEDYLNALEKQARAHNTAVILGLPMEEGNQYFNSVMGLGSAMGIYHKRHLVPFGEYLPFDALLRGLIRFFDLPMSNFSEGDPQQKPINLLGFDIATELCYEVAYPAQFLSSFPEAELIVTLSNDAWFGDSFAASQQLQIARMRSIETSRYQLIATDNGVTAIVDPKGAVTARLPRFEFGVLKGEVFAMSGSTPLVRLGSGPLLFILFVLLGLAVAFRWKS